MKRKIVVKLAAFVMAVAMLIGSTGCDAAMFGATKLLFDVSSGISGIAGFILGSTAGSTPRCYMNGEEIDCNNLPENLQP